jgi:signal transduction histidine kinase
MWLCELIARSFRPRSIADRSIAVELRCRSDEAATIAQLRHGRTSRFSELASKARRWANDNVERIRDIEAASLAQLGSAKTREEMTEDAARRAVLHLPGIHELKTAIAARLGMSEDNLQRYDELMDASDAVVDLIRSAKLDAAEVAARDLLARFPDQPDGWDFGMVYEARGENQKAAEAYRKVIEFIRQHPDAHPPGFEDPFVRLVDRLDPPQPRS